MAIFASLFQFQLSQFNNGVGRQLNFLHFLANKTLVIISASIFLTTVIRLPSFTLLCFLQWWYRGMGEYSSPPAFYQKIFSEDIVVQGEKMCDWNRKNLKRAWNN